MAARRCAKCNRNYPLGVRVCPGCGRPTRRNYEVSPDPPIKGPWTKPPPATPKIEPLPAVTKDRLGEWPEGSGQIWIADASLEHDGYGPGAYLQTGDVIKVLMNSSLVYYELGAHVYDGGLGGWWLNRMENEWEMFSKLPITSKDDAR